MTLLSNRTGFVGTQDGTLTSIVSIEATQSLTVSAITSLFLCEAHLRFEGCGFFVFVFLVWTLHVL